MERYSAQLVSALLFSIAGLIFFIGVGMIYEAWGANAIYSQTTMIGSAFSTAGLLLMCCQLACREVLFSTAMMPCLWRRFLSWSFQAKHR